ncbi:uncharacterized protein K460DRAFT_365755 [Cucurbitaria berberidis CBS 394.84]|uniref:Uncharacterized protein n=1 Tax=Cucurbitaria berberidis CBS 394.84 TaxID=1168544 RepID=A0A9P4L788_9PLEO|nr:uncharacterized protein K460DRAFT_365755 [Cucurbitaria berberidis CBS 394.84]KAF1844791.1 hypothetical protein K460DRAFT_365755 [Cucurbitaria berberidis CBS 394.84]
MYSFTPTPKSSSEQMDSARIQSFESNHLHQEDEHIVLVQNAAFESVTSCTNPHCLFPNSRHSSASGAEECRCVRKEVKEKSRIAQVDLPEPEESIPSSISTPKSCHTERRHAPLPSSTHSITPVSSTDYEIPLTPGPASNVRQLAAKFAGMCTEMTYPGRINVITNISALKVLSQNQR